MRKKPTIAGLQRDLAAAVEAEAKQAERAEKAESLARKTEYKRAEAAKREDELRERLMFANQRISFLEGKIEGMQWMLQQVPADEQ